MSESAEFAVRDTRQPGHCWADNEVLDVYGRLIGSDGVAVYMVLARHATNGTGRCRVSLRRIAETVDLSVGGVFNAMERLTQFRLVLKENDGDCRTPATYVLGDVKQLVSTGDPQLQLPCTVPSVHTVNTSVHMVNSSVHPMNAAFTPRTPNKERKTSYKTNTKSINPHASGAMTHWLTAKAKLEGALTRAEFNCWLRPMYLLKVMGSTLLLALPPSGRIIAAARAQKETLRRVVAEFGYQEVAFTRYPDQYERSRVRAEYPEFYEQMYGNKHAESSAAV